MRLGMRDSTAGTGDGCTGRCGAVGGGPPFRQVAQYESPCFPAHPVISPARLLFALALALAAFPSARADVVINEIMYRPGTTTPTFTGENAAREFIELHNPAAAAVDISGWALTSGVGYTFPAATAIPGGGFVVIASDPAAVQTLYGISGVFGPWTAGATLSNSGEKIELSKPGVTPGTFVKVDAVTYASEGDWAVRVRETTFNGWDWSTPANGGNKSMELRNPAISNDNGQNWAPSTAAAGATPGAANSVLTNNLPPIISGVKHFPAVPKSTDSVTISCDVNDEAAPQFLAATLFWRDATSATPGAFQSQAMTGDGTGKFSTTLGAKANLVIVEFYVSVTDGVSTRTWPAPTSEGQNANAQYQVTNEALSATEAYYFLILTGAENAAYNTTAPSDSSSNKIDRQFNTTLVVSNGTETTIRYRSQIRFRGNSSRGYTFKPLRVSIPGDDPWDGGTGFNVNPKASFLQFMGMRMMQAAGVRAPDSIPIRPRRNGVNYTTSSDPTPDYGLWVREEDLNGDFVGNHFPQARDGGIYKKGRPDEYWRNTGWTVPTNPDGNIDGWLKQNNGSANDWTDLTSFFATAQAVTAPHFPGAPANNSANAAGSALSGVGNWNSTAFSAAEITTLETAADLDQWARWFAVITILQNFETNISNGQDDDYAIYFAPNALGQRRANLVTHDMDTIFGLGDTAGAYNSVGLYDMTDNGSVFRPLLPLFGSNTVAGNAAFRQKYFDALRDLFGTVFNADTTGNPNPPFYQFVDSHLTGWGTIPAATITAIKTFVNQRQTYLLGLIGSGATTPAAATSTATVASTPGTLMIHEVLADNVAAHQNGTGFPDVIELFNSGGTAIDLAGRSLTDDPLVKAKYVFPAGTTIAAGGYRIVYADTDLTAPGLHAGFALDAQGDGVYLFDTVANGQTQLDAITFGLQATDFSIGRTGAARDVWALCTPTIGAANTAVASLAAPGGLKINEWAGNRDYLLSEDFLELYNAAAQPVAVGAMTLTDDYINYPLKFALPQLSFIGPGAFVRFDAKGGSATDGNAAELPFNIDASVGWLALIGQNGTIVDRVDVVAQPQDTSRGRSPNGGTTIATFGLPTNLPTPGSSNVNPPANVLALVNGLRISELLYTPATLEYIELHNIGAGTLDLSGVRFTKGVTYTFDPGTTLAAGAYLVVCHDRAAFQAQFGGAVPLAAGVFTGTLDNAGEVVALKPPAPWDVNILNFKYDPAWFVPDTDNGYSLTVRDDVTTPARDWDEKSTWSPSPALYGTPGADSAPTITSALTASADIASAFSYQIVATKNPASYNALPLPTGLSVNTANGLISGTPTQTGTFNVTLSATNAVGTGTRTLVLTVTTGPVPVITSGLTASGVAGTAFTYQIVATNSPSSYNATPLPAGLAINTGTGLISGTPTAAGTTNVTISATNANGTDSRTLVLTVTAPPAPVVTSAGTASGVVGDAFTYQIIATNSPASYNATGLPAGLSVNTSSGLISGTPTVAGTSNVTLSATNAGGTGTKALTLTVATSGPLAAFAWSSIATTQQTGVPFAVTLTAQDSQGRTVTSFNGSVNFTASAPGAGSGATIVLTECSIATIDGWELQNVSSAAVNTTGWFVVMNNGSTGVNTIHTTVALPASLAASEIFFRNEDSTDPAHYFGFTISWPAAGPGWAMLVDNTGVIRDFVVWGYTQAQIATINFTAGGFALNPSAQSAWTGAGETIAIAYGITEALLRTGTDDHNNETDWARGTASRGVQNTGLTLPFPSGSINVPITPASVTCANGVFTGSISAGAVATGARITANDGASHTGLSNSFNTVAPPAPVITSPTSAIAVVNQPFSYQILATNYIASYNATNLPAGLSVSTTTGLISGTPSAAATTSVTLSAINFGGTGNATLSLQVQADSDADGMGDAWETANGLVVGTNDAGGDKDGDGQSNLAEWLAGTAPNSSASVLRILTEQSVGADMQLTWNSVIGKRYRIVSRTSLASGSWIDLTPAPVVATSITSAFTHTGGASGAARYYRVEIVP